MTWPAGPAVRRSPGGELVEKLERLEDEPDLVAPQLRQGALRELIDAAILEEQLTRGWPVKAAKQVEEGRLPAAAGTHHG
jgi:hypothetical protein